MFAIYFICHSAHCWISISRQVLYCNCQMPSFLWSVIIMSGIQGVLFGNGVSVRPWLCPFLHEATLITSACNSCSCWNEKTAIMQIMHHWNSNAPGPDKHMHGWNQQNPTCSGNKPRNQWNLGRGKLHGGELGCT